MLRIINGKRYNTETANNVLSLFKGIPDSRSDFRWEDTNLYVTGKGSWFLAGRGNAMSRWASSHGNMQGPGQGIQPISGEEARSLLEEHDEIDLIEKYFGNEVSDA